MKMTHYYVDGNSREFYLNTWESETEPAYKNIKVMFNQTTTELKFTSLDDVNEFCEILTRRAELLWKVDKVSG